MKRTKCIKSLSFVLSLFALIIGFSISSYVAFAEDCEFNADCPSDEYCDQGVCKKYSKDRNLRGQIYSWQPTPTPTLTPFPTPTPTYPFPTPTPTLTPFPTPTPTSTPFPTPTPTFTLVPCPNGQTCTIPGACPSPNIYNTSSPICDYSDLSKHCCCPAEFAAKRIIDHLQIMLGSVVALTGPVLPGSIIKEDLPQGDGSSPVVLGIPSPYGQYLEANPPARNGQYFAFFIDDNPNFRYEHPVRYAWYNCNDDTYSVTNANWRMTIYPPNRLPTPYAPKWLSVIDGVKVTFGTGEFAGEVFLNPDKPIGGSISTTSLYKRNLLEKIIDGFSLSHTAKAQLAPPAVPKCIKEAFVFDTGDKNTWFNLAADFAADADLIETYLKNMEFNVTRRSNYWKNNLPPIAPNYFSFVLDSFLSTVDTKIRNENKVGAVQQCVKHEVFLYLNGHGGNYGNGYIDIYQPDGSGSSNIRLVAI